MATTTVTIPARQWTLVASSGDTGYISNESIFNLRYVEDTTTPTDLDRKGHTLGHRKSVEPPSGVYISLAGGNNLYMLQSKESLYGDDHPDATVVFTSDT